MATGGFVHHSIAIQSTICSILRCLVVFLACVQGRRKVRVRVRVRATLALQLDFSVFWKPFVATYTGQLAGRLQNEDWTRTGGCGRTNKLYFVSPIVQQPHTGSRNHPRNTPKSACGASSAVALTRLPLSPALRTCKKNRTTDCSRCLQRMNWTADGRHSEMPVAVRSITVLLSVSLSTCATSTTRWTRCSS